MTKVTTIATKTGNVNINAALFQGYIDEAFDHLEAAAAAVEKFKEVVETVSETTGLKKPVVSKYLKARYETKTKDAKELGELYTALDNATVGA
jgi:predicted solute-binding protein